MSAHPLPHLRRDAARPHLVVDGEPFLVLGAEVHNSSTGGVAAIGPALDRVVAAGANTALAPVTWELLEPREGEFDLAILDALVVAARERDLRLIVLWFGSWKNGQSSYVPAWMKTNPVRFPRAETAAEGAIEHVSPFGPDARDADARAFARLMARIRELDAGRSTVIMVQVENEVGLLGDSRDRSALAVGAHGGAVPAEVIAAVEAAPSIPAHEAWRQNGSRRDGTWAEVFGETPCADEAFMAWAYASYVEAVAAAGLHEHALPLFTNAWMDTAPDVADADAVPTGGIAPGDYPSGGPVPGVVPLWRAAAPSLDLVCPDPYGGDIDDILRAYATLGGGAVFVPEMRRDEFGAGQFLSVIGNHPALGASPFGIDSGPEGTPDALADAMALVSALSGPILAAAPGSMRAFHLHSGRPDVDFDLGGHRFTASRIRPWGGPQVPEQAYGLVVAVAPDEFVAIGRGFALLPHSPESRRVGILAVDELAPHDVGPVRRLNGDETGAGSQWRHPGRGHALVGSLPIPTVGEGTGISRCTLYSW